MKAIILAAGMGTRMFPLTKNTPKSLLDIGQGLTLLETQLHSLQEAGITNIVLVIGYRAEQIEAKIKEYEKDFKISIVFNPFFDTSNNLISAWMARHHMTDEFITINGDDIFDSIVIKDLLKSNENITMITDVKDEYDSDDMKIVSNNGLVEKVSKKVPIEEANGESVGIIKFSGHGPKIYTDTLEEMVRDPENLQVFYLKAIQQIIDKGFSVHHSVCNEHDWGEIDFHPDLKLIRQYVSKTNLVERIFNKK